MNGCQKLNEGSSPEKEVFYSTLNIEKCYGQGHAKRV